MSDMVLRDTEEVDFSVNWDDVEGQATTAPANVAATSSDTNVCNVVDNGDGSFIVTTTGQALADSVTIEVTGDGITTPPSATVQVLPSVATGGNFSFGTPRLRQDVTPAPPTPPESSPRPHAHRVGR